MSIKILRAEHTLILKMLEKAESARNIMEEGKNPDPGFFFKIVRFEKEFVDRIHHFKEEYIIFGVLGQKKDGALDGDLGALRFQHERSKKCFMEIESSLDAYKKGDEIATTHILINLGALISVMRRHIALEESIYIPKSLEIFEDEDTAVFKREYEKALSDQKEVFRENLALIDEMEEILSV